eukprot:CAMPEP_0197664226 /NCGR_PEP_ID=MMETSP1338-20131121/58505_1 /TAXON_ID=43686 ORGANISM="Pelagodinium beii, Strain RCC1491" /NCGR_SAMPLE_ID=MMETSP1338 /ASSEMBLY_ACC=CAM_ASM_000754 /LENGTH=454 /DNA_ID=CAMNT_0043242815 /DNA_START=200 /DNA_END=1565 /DNA_ORIENTATION=-
MNQLQEDDENLELPAAFKAFSLSVQFMFMANYTVILPTSHDYVASLGGGGWFAGTVVAASLGSGLLTIPMVGCLFGKSYKPALFILLACCAVGNALYGLGQMVQSFWMLLAGQVVRGFMWGGCGRTLPQHVAYNCIGKKLRSAWTATSGNVGFLGMGMGPVFAAAISKVNFSVGLLQVDEFTNPGWFFCVFWLLLLAALIFIPEPPRPFAVKVQNNDVSSGSVKPNGQILWSLSTMAIASAAVAAWETSAAVVTQKYFTWSLLTSSLFIGLVFLSSTLGGEGVKLLVRKRELREADVITVSLVAMVLSSTLLYWYLPTAAGKERRLGNEITYSIGSIVMLNAANVGRSYSNSLAMRASASVSNRMKDWAVGAQAFFMMLGRSLGALCGMGIATMPGGANEAAGFMTCISALMLAFLLIPELFADSAMPSKSTAMLNPSSMETKKHELFSDFNFW